MPECPVCHAEIDALKNYQSGEKVFWFDGEDYQEDDFVPDDATNDYECPECCETLFTSEVDARNFLLGK